MNTTRDEPDGLRRRLPTSLGATYQARAVYLPRFRTGSIASLDVENHEYLDVSPVFGWDINLHQMESGSACKASWTISRCRRRCKLRGRVETRDWSIFSSQAFPQSPL